MPKFNRFCHNLFWKGFILTLFLFSAGTNAEDKELEELRKNVPNEVKLNMEKNFPKSTDYCEPLNAPLLKKMISMVDVPRKEMLETETHFRDWPLYIDYNWGPASNVKDKKGKIWAGEALYLKENLTDQTEVKFDYFQHILSRVTNSYVTRCVYDVNGRKISIEHH